MFLTSDFKVSKKKNEKKGRRSSELIVLPGEENLITQDSLGNRSSILRTPESSEVIGQSSTIATDGIEINKSQTAERFLKVISPNRSKDPSHRRLLSKLKLGAVDLNRT